SNPTRDWDIVIGCIQRLCSDAKKDDRDQAKRYFSNQLLESNCSKKNEQRHVAQKHDLLAKRDQTISGIEPSPGNFYDANYHIEERMASEWNHHKYGDFVKNPKEQQLKTEEPNELAQAFTEFEARNAIDHLKRHKSGGTTGLNHDFYNDFKDELAPGLTKVFNYILNGDDITSSFLEAIIVPLRKKGDSWNAKDYRPLSLLNTAWKFGASVS
ncbi:putative reverse transcriptase domain-containing protein, partial [Phytophthora infestans]